MEYFVCEHENILAYGTPHNKLIQRNLPDNHHPVSTIDHPSGTSLECLKIWMPDRTFPA
jgi:hypothetical protein